MKPTTILLNAIEEKNYSRIVSALMGYIFVDKSMREFKEAWDYTRKQGISDSMLLKKYDPEFRPIVENSSSWNEDYYCTALRGLEDNFCMERVKHLEAVARKLYPNLFAQRTTAPVKTEQSGTRMDESSKKALRRENQQSPMLPAVMVGGIILLVIIVFVIILMT